MCVDEDPDLQDLHRDPPSKGIVPSWAQQRIDQSPLRHGAPPEAPDFELLGLDPIHCPAEIPVWMCASRASASRMTRLRP